LSIEPEMLLLDEPPSALDSETRAKLRKELRRIHSVTHTTMVHVTHGFDGAFLLGSRVAIMHNREIVQAGEPSDVFGKPNCKFVAECLGVTNVFQGEAVIDNGNSCINVNGLKIRSATARDGKIYASVRPEDILVSLKPIESSARNFFQGEIQDISDAGIVLRITADAGIPFVAAITSAPFSIWVSNRG
jgi:ABC-type Fe3+/spermidine/putrescine transport system ATPase subunit